MKRLKFILFALILSLGLSAQLVFADTLASGIHFSKEQQGDEIVITITNNDGPTAGGNWRLGILPQGDAQWQINGQAANFADNSGYFQLSSPLSQGEQKTISVRAEGYPNGQHHAQIVLWTTQGAPQYPFNGTILGMANLTFNNENNNTNDTNNDEEKDNNNNIDAEKPAEKPEEQYPYEPKVPYPPYEPKVPPYEPAPPYTPPYTPPYAPPYEPEPHPPYEPDGENEFPEHGNDENYSPEYELVESEPELTPPTQPYQPPEQPPPPQNLPEIVTSQPEIAGEIVAGEAPQDYYKDLIYYLAEIASETYKNIQTQPEIEISEEIIYVKPIIEEVIEEEVIEEEAPSELVIADEPQQVANPQTSDKKPLTLVYAILTSAACIFTLTYAKDRKNGQI